MRRRERVEAGQLDTGIAETRVWGNVKQTVTGHDAVSAGAANPVVLGIDAAGQTDELYSPVGRNNEIFGGLALVTAEMMALGKHVIGVETCRHLARPQISSDKALAHPMPRQVIRNEKFLAAGWLLSSPDGSACVHGQRPYFLPA